MLTTFGPITYLPFNTPEWKIASLRDLPGREHTIAFLPPKSHALGDNALGGKLPETKIRNQEMAIETPAAIGE